MADISLWPGLKFVRLALPKGDADRAQGGWLCLEGLRR